MDPTTLMQLIQHLRQQGQMQPQGQMPPMQGQMPSMSPPQGAPQPGPDDPSQSQDGHHGLKFNPLMLLSPMGGLFASSPKTAMSLMSPAFGIANLLGAFK